MSDKKKWRGIQHNEVTHQGEIVNDPVFNGEYAFMNLESFLTQRDQNGQYTDVDQIVPLMVEPGSPQLRVVRDFIKAGRKLHVNGQFKSWVAEGVTHTVVVVGRIKLGDKPYEPSSEGAVPLPPG